jgi:hypothetical protein
MERAKPVEWRKTAIFALGRKERFESRFQMLGIFTAIWGSYLAFAGSGAIP